MGFTGIARWPNWACLLFLVGIGAVPRLVTIGRESLWFDEAVSYLAAMQPVTAILDNTAQSSHPPLYYLFLHFWLKWLPHTDIVARLLGLFWDLALIPVGYLLALELFSERWSALFAALSVAVSPFHVLYSVELRMYTQLMFLVSLGALAYLRARRTGLWRWWLLFLVTFLAALYTHLFALLALAAIGLYALLYRGRRRVLWLTVLSIALLVLSFVPWARTMLGESHGELGSMRPLGQSERLNPIKLLTSLVFLVFGRSVHWPYSALALFLTISTGLILVLEALKGRKERELAGVTLSSLMVLCIVGVPGLVYYVRPFFLPERTMAAASPFLLFLISWGIGRRKSPLPYLAYASAVVMLVGSLLYLVGDLVKPPYRDAMRLVAQHRADDDAVLHTSDGSYLPALCYVDFGRHAVLDGDPDPRKPRTVYRKLGGDVWTVEQADLAGRRLWLIVALEHSVDWQRDRADRFAEQYVALQRYDVNGIGIHLYDLTAKDAQ